MSKNSFLKTLFTGAMSLALGAAVLSVGPQESQAVTGEMFDYKGYFRAGTGVNGKGAEQDCLNLGEARFVGRLGNECDTYLEQVFVAKFLKQQTSSDPQFKSVVTFAYQSQGDKSWEESGEEVWKLREAFTEASNPFGNGMKFWAGKRFYRERDAHIIDYWYFANVNGYGGGTEIPAGNANVKLAFLTATNQDLGTENGQPNLQIWDARLNSLEVMDSLSFDFWLAFGSIAGGETADTTDDTGNVTPGTEYESQSGTAFGVLADWTLPGLGWNHLSYQQGEKAMWGLSDWVGPVQKDAWDDDSPSRNLLLDQLMLEFGKLSVNAVFAQQNNVYAGGDEQDYTVFVARPQYALDEHLAIAAELGQVTEKTNIKSGDEYEVSLNKFTISPQINVNSTFWGRPSIRFFYSMFNWSGDDDHPWGARINSQNGYFNQYNWDDDAASNWDDTSASSWGFQTEVWW